ncbi:MAG TPA: hypothetical protein VEC93_05860 [Anaerolineae bacterium]|nr:hypothetical protein [Anaerolineae bacterium]
MYAETAETITLFSPPGLKYWDHRQTAWFEAQDGLIEIYFKHNMNDRSNSTTSLKLICKPGKG